MILPAGLLCRTEVLAISFFNIFEGNAKPPVELFAFKTACLCLAEREALLASLEPLMVADLMVGSFKGDLSSVISPVDAIDGRFTESPLATLSKEKDDFL